MNNNTQSQCGSSSNQKIPTANCKSTEEIASWIKRISFFWQITKYETRQQLQGRARQSTGTPNFPSTRVPRPSLNRSSQPTIHPNNRMNGQMFRERSDSNFSHIGEGGDVLISQRQCSVSTETDGTQTADRLGNFDARIRTVREYILLLKKKQMVLEEIIPMTANKSQRYVF
ncbi:hypothetical protein CEXT_16811 [Caerostris extrusa]|uniref:Uncharacterized protein n=1 Tax=Caerostris extrusa TaxID=172846 RepID=A0AAV4NUW5_CAEEX|nr:hypothetical protein CEXT_16811 [Caerostris extrusa]